ncbi:hypothetical protein [Micromonospora robiginosa]|uniref:Uncharacterized protein n=1 Tax=Micromonospora robiginosa TaxID=2749844 RepID=A0A7L6B1K2_9ACTN
MRGGLGLLLLVLPCAEPGGITVPAEDDQNVRHRVFCAAPMANGLRCFLGADHDGPCARRLLPAGERFGSGLPVDQKLRDYVTRR